MKPVRLLSAALGASVTDLSSLDTFLAHRARHVLGTTASKMDQLQVLLAGKRTNTCKQSTVPVTGLQT
jgi:hypothetical protein